MNDNDEVRDSSVRKEIDSNGRPVRTRHDTVVRFSRGLKPFVTIDGKPVAVVGSTGDNASPDHALPKEGQVLVPLPALARVVSGVDWFTVDGASVAVASSTVRVPDAENAEKSDVLRVAQAFLRAGGQPVARGTGNFPPGPTASGPAVARGKEPLRRRRSWKSAASFGVRR